MSYRHSKDMDVYYEEVDERNRQRYLQQKQEGKNPKNYGFVSRVNPIKNEPAKKQSLTEDELKAKIRQIEETATQAKAQAPPIAPAKEENLAIGKINLLATSTPPPSPTPTIEVKTDSTQNDGITVFSDEDGESDRSPTTMPLSSIIAKLKPTGTNSQSDSGTPKTATIVKPVKPPRSKIYSNNKEL